jgi:hypothetical protein
MGSRSLPELARVFLKLGATTVAASLLVAGVSAAYAADTIRTVKRRNLAGSGRYRSCDPLFHAMAEASRRIGACLPVRSAVLSAAGMPLPPWTFRRVPTVGLL